MDYDVVVLVEQRAKSRFDQADSEVRRVESFDKTIEGSVLL